MKVLAIVNEALTKVYDDVVIEKVVLDGRSVFFSLLELEDTLFDEFAKENEYKVLVRKKAFSVNYRDKGLIFSAAKYFENNPTSFSYFPFGSEFSGIVEKIGSKVQDLKVGDRVIGNAAYPFSGHLNVAPGIVTNNASKELEVLHCCKLLKIPEFMTFEDAAAIAVGAQTSYSMVRRTNVVKTDTVLVTAATSNTSMCVISALSGKCDNIYVLSTSKDNRPKLLELGATQFIYYDKALDFQDERQEFMQHIEKGLKFNVIFDPFNDIYLHKTVESLDYFGRYITCGVFNQVEIQQDPFLAGEVVPDVTQMLHFAIAKNISFMGNCLGSKEDLEAAIHDIKNGVFKVIVDSVFGENDFVQFIYRSYIDKNRFGKVVMLYQ